MLVLLRIQSYLKCATNPTNPRGSKPKTKHDVTTGHPDFAPAMKTGSSRLLGFSLSLKRSTIIVKAKVSMCVTS